MKHLRRFYAAHFVLLIIMLISMLICSVILVILDSSSIIAGISGFAALFAAIELIKWKHGDPLLPFNTGSLVRYLTKTEQLERYPEICLNISIICSFILWISFPIAVIKHVITIVA